MKLIGNTALLLLFIWAVWPRAMQVYSAYRQIQEVRTQVQRVTNVGGLFVGGEGK